MHRKSMHNMHKRSTVFLCMLPIDKHMNSVYNNNCQEGTGGNAMKIKVKKSTTVTVTTTTTIEVDPPGKTKSPAEPKPKPSNPINNINIINHN
nr:MAG TPA: hypothetical protein [Caudoviricetes sp.]